MSKLINKNIFRYTNPEWDPNKTTAPSIQLGITSSEFLISAKWNSSWVTQYPQCVDKIVLGNAILKLNIYDYTITLSNLVIPSTLKAISYKSDLANP